MADDVALAVDSRCCCCRPASSNIILVGERDGGLGSSATSSPSPPPFVVLLRFVSALLTVQRLVLSCASKKLSLPASSSSVSASASWSARTVSCDSDLSCPLRLATLPTENVEVLTPAASVNGSETTTTAGGEGMPPSVLGVVGLAGEGEVAAVEGVAVVTGLPPPPSRTNPA